MPPPQDMQQVLARNGHFGWIPPQQRNATQRAADGIAKARQIAFTLAPPSLPVGTKIILSSLWSDPDCVADMGQVFTGFRQLTGSCVGVSNGNAVCTLSCVQRKLTSGATKAFIPWWPFAYGRTRLAEGDHGQGEGAIDSVMGQVIGTQGIFGVQEAQGLPSFDTSDGFAITSRQEMQYSDGNYSGNTQYLSTAATHLVGSRAPLSSTDDIVAAIANGYPVLDGCDDYVGHGKVDSNGVCLGQYDGRGGHSTTFEGLWNHPQLGMLLLYGNQWDGNTYPEDGSGKRRCSVWMMVANAARLFSLGGGGGETMALSHLNYFPAQPAVWQWAS